MRLEAEAGSGWIMLEMTGEETWRVGVAEHANWEGEVFRLNFQSLNPWAPRDPLEVPHITSGLLGLFIGFSGVLVKTTSSLFHS